MEGRETAIYLGDGRFYLESAMIGNPSIRAFRREYHAITRGFIIQEIFRRVEPKGRSIGQFLKEEITDVLGADVFIGMKEEEQLEHVIVDVEQHMDQEVEEAAISAGREDIRQILEKYRQYLGETEGKRPDHKDTWVNMSGTHSAETRLPHSLSWNSVAARRAEIPSAGGLASARGLALLAAVLANGGAWDGKTFLTELGWGQMHSNATQGETFGMKTFYTQVQFLDAAAQMTPKTHQGTAGRCLTKYKGKYFCYVNDGAGSRCPDKQESIRAAKWWSYVAYDSYEDPPIKG